MRERLEAQHRLGDALNRTVLLFENVVEVLDLAYSDRNRHTAIKLIGGDLFGAAFIHCDLVRSAILTHDFSKNRPATAV